MCLQQKNAELICKGTSNKQFDILYLGKGMLCNVFLLTLKYGRIWLNAMNGYVDDWMDR